MVRPDRSDRARPAADSPLARATAFLAAFARRQAERVVEVPGGFAVLDPQFAASYLHNRVILTGAVDAVAALVAADGVLAAAGLAHRLVDAHRDIDPAPFLTAGYDHSSNLVMCHGGGPPDRPADPGVRVEPIDLATMRAEGLREWRADYPDAAPAFIEQLAGRRVRLLRGADQVLFLGVRDGAAVVSHGDLYLEPRLRVAQIESVQTDPEYRDRGLARAVLAEGMRRARQAGCDLVFLVADEHDWPRRLYERLGYVPVGRIHGLLRAPAVPGEPCTGPGGGD